MRPPPRSAERFPPLSRGWGSYLPRGRRARLHRRSPAARRADRSFSPTRRISGADARFFCSTSREGCEGGGGGARATVNDRARSGGDTAPPPDTRHPVESPPPSRHLEDSVSLHPTAPSCTDRPQPAQRRRRAEAAAARGRRRPPPPTPRAYHPRKGHPCVRLLVMRLLASVRFQPSPVLALPKIKLKKKTILRRKKKSICILR
jgi:hypothetical protein